MPNKFIKDQVGIEIENLQRLLQEMKQLLTKTGRGKRFLEVRAAGSILHDFYCGIEKIFERIAVAIDKNLPGGESWHMELLLQMAEPFKDIRDEFISKDLMQKLKEYLRFRHLFRNIYGFELKWNRINYLCVEMEKVFNEFKNEINDFFIKPA